MSNRSKFLMVLCVLVFSVTMTAITVYGAKAQAVGQFTASEDLIIRDAPGWDADAIGTLQAGDTLTIYGVPVHADDVLWGATRPQLRSWVPLWTGACIEYWKFTNGKQTCIARAKDHKYGEYIEK